MKRIVSAIPGRIRVRDPLLRDARRLERLRARVAALDGVRSVDDNAKTGSLLMHYDVASVAPAAIEASVEAAAAAELPPATTGRTATPTPRRPRPAREVRSEWEATGHVERRGPPHSRRALARRLNGYAKLGMFASLGASLGLAAAGAKRLHIATGGVYLALLGIHLAVHRRHLLK